MHNVNLLIKPASGMCNLKCEYCFYNDVSQRREKTSFGFMSIETFEEIIKKAIDYSERELTVAFQGGEPTLIGLDFYKKAVELEKKYNKKNIIINNALQTNGVTLDEEWADFFKENDFLIGVSLDGIRETHNKNRGNSFDEVFKTIELFKSRGVQFNVLTVINNITAKKAKEIYEFYREEQIDFVQLIPCIEPFETNENRFLTPENFGGFLIDVFSLWFEDFKREKEININLFESYIAMLLGFPSQTCGMGGLCSYQYVIEADGSVYPCDFFVFDEYRIGNLLSDSFEDINKKRNEMRFIEASYSLNIKCKTCKYFPLCRGGCKRYRSPDGLNVLCEGYQMFFEACAERLAEIAKKIV